jgi:hypothetical protein
MAAQQPDQNHPTCGICLQQETQCTCNVTGRRVRAIIVTVEEQLVLHNLSVCLQPQVSIIQCACAILPSVACPALQYFPTLSHKRQDFRGEKVTGHKMCFWISPTPLFQTFLFLRRNERERGRERDGQKCLVVFM